MLEKKKLFNAEPVPGVGRSILSKKKQLGQYRFRIDFLSLNAVTEHDPYSLPYLNDFH